MYLEKQRGAAVRLGNQQVVHEGIWLSLSITAAPLFALSERSVSVPVSLKASPSRKKNTLIGQFSQAWYMHLSAER